MNVKNCQFLLFIYSFILITEVKSSSQHTETANVGFTSNLYLTYDSFQAFHCAEPGSRHISCLPLFLSLLTYEVYYQSDTAEGSTQTDVSLIQHVPTQNFETLVWY